MPRAQIVEHGLQGFASREDAGWVAQSLLFERELHAMARALADRDIPMLVLKGGALRRWLYPRAALRAMSDIDILVPPGQVELACDEAAKLGYRAAVHAGGALIFTAWQLVRQVGQLPVPLDLHWEIGSRPVLRGRFDFAELWAARQDLGEGLFGLGAEYALAHACMHRAALAEHRRGRLIWLLDVHLLWEALPFERQGHVVQLCIDKGIAGLVYDALGAARHSWGTTVAPEFRQRLDDAAVNEESAMLLHRNAGLGALLFDLRALPTMRERAGYLRQLAFPPGSYMSGHFGRGPLFWKYLVRGARGVRKLFVR